MTLYYNPEFRPLLSMFGKEDQRWRVAKLYMADEATPVRIERNKKAAIWVGKRITCNGDLPVISVVADPTWSMDYVWQADWYCGAVNYEAVLNSSEPLTVLFDAPGGKVHNPGEAVENLNTLLPVSNLTTNPAIVIPELDQILAVRPDTV